MARMGGMIMAFDPVSFAMGAKSGGGGSSGGVLVVGLDMQTMTLDKTWQEIVDAGFAVLPYSEDGETTVIFYLYSYTNNGSSYGVVFKQQAIELTCAATSADGYPVVQPGG